jgi:glycosyl transferase family 61
VSTARVEQVFALRARIGRAMPEPLTRRHGYFYVWRRVVVERMLRAARAGGAPGFATTTVDAAVAATPGARSVVHQPAAPLPFPLPRVHTARRWLLDVQAPPRRIDWPATRVLDLPNGVVLGHEGVVGPDPDTIVTDLGYVYPIEERELFRRADAARQRGREDLPGTTMSMLQHYPSNFSHNLVQGVPRLDMFRRAVHFDAVDRVLIDRSAPGVTREALARAGFGADRVVEVPDDTPALVCERLLTATCLPQNSGTPPWARAFLNELFGVVPSRAMPRRIFVTRGTGDARGVVNHDEVSAALVARGFTECSMEGLTRDEQTALFAGADVIVGVHGAALANLVFARPGTRVIELVGANTLNWVYSPLSWAAGLEHDVLVGVEPTPSPAFWTWQRDADQVVDVDRLRRLVDAALAHVGAPT